MPPAVCRRLVGRDVERGLLLRVLERASHGSGSTVALLGDAGIGKSALAREIGKAAAAAGLPVLMGRAVLGTGTPAYRSIVEALLGVLRAQGLPETPELDPFRDELTRLLPVEATPGAPRLPLGEPTMELCEGVLRLLETLAGDTGLLLIQEDLQWADDRSLQVLEYIADNLAGRRILMLATGRLEVPVPGIERLRALQARGAVTGVNLHPLDADEVAELAAVTLGTELAGVPAELAAWLRDWSDGMPALVIDLLGTATHRGLLREEGGWRFDAPGPDTPPVVPDQVAETVRRHLADLGPQQLDVLRYATVLGRDFDARLLPGLTGIGASDVDGLLVALRDRQLVEPRPGGQTTHRFRRALWHGALGTELVGFQQEQLANQALELVREQHPGLPGPWCEYAAELAERAGAAAVAAELLARTGQRALQAGAFARAESVLERAREHLRSEGAEDPDVELLLLQVLADSGQPVRAREVGASLLELEGRAGVAPESRVTARLLLARVASLAGDPAQVTAQLEGARRIAEPVPTLLAMVDLAEVMCGGTVEPDEATSRARDVLAKTDTAPDVVLDAETAGLRCDAYRILGLAAMPRDLQEAEVEYSRALAIAEDHRLAYQRLVSLHQLGRISALETFRLDGLDRIRDAADGVGALSESAELDLTLSAVRTLRMDLAEGLEIAVRCEHTARRLGLDAVLPRAIAAQAVNHAMARRADELERCGAVLLRMRGIDPTDIATMWGQARAEYSLGRENRSQALFELDTAMRQLQGRPARPWPMRGVWVLLRALEDIDPHSARAAVRGGGWAETPLIRAHLTYADAIELGRVGEVGHAEQAFADAEQLMAKLDGASWLHHRARRLVAEAAIADGWGDPVTWLRAALDSFARSGHIEAAAACRSMLRGLGVPVPRQRRQVVPDALYQFGITARELEVLGLIAARLSNAQIGRELFISTRTVEKHVERLLGKTSATSRQELVAWAERTLGQTPGGQLEIG